MKLANLEQAFADMNNGLYDFTDNGECSQCGNCCSRYLMLSDKELRQIHRYVKKHNIKVCQHTIPLRKDTLDLCCPFLDMNKSSEKCRIYEVRPAICKGFICNPQKREDKDRVQADKKLLKDSTIFVDMWEEFGGQL